MVTLFGNYIYTEYSLGAWNTASFMALIMLIIIGIAMLVTRNVDKEEDSRTQLW